MGIVFGPCVVVEEVVVWWVCAARRRSATRAGVVLRSRERWSGEKKECKER